MCRIEKLFVNAEYHINFTNGIPLKKALKQFGFHHLIKEEYRPNELEQLEELMIQYKNCNNLEELHRICNIAADWWRNQLVNPEIDNINILKFLYRILNSKYYRNCTLNSIETMEQFTDIFHELLFAKLLLEQEVDLYYPNDEDSILKQAIDQSKVKEYNHHKKYMHIEKDKIQVEYDLKKEYLYYSYQKRKIKGTK